MGRKINDIMKYLGNAPAHYMLMTSVSVITQCIIFPKLKAMNHTSSKNLQIQKI